jgi:hypothetical protein
MNVVNMYVPSVPVVDIFFVIIDTCFSAMTAGLPVGPGHTPVCCTFCGQCECETVQQIIVMLYVTSANDIAHGQLGEGAIFWSVIFQPVDASDGVVYLCPECSGGCCVLFVHFSTIHFFSISFEFKTVSHICI